MGKYGIGRVATMIATNGDNGMIEITYHQTRVVRYNEDSIVLNSGGYRTVTTKRRMNEASQTFGLGYRVYQSKSDWFVIYGGREYQFVDNMILDRIGKHAYDSTGEPLQPIAGLVDGIGIVKWEKFIP